MKRIFSLLISFSLIISPVRLAHAAEENQGKAEQLFQMTTGILGSTILIKCPNGRTSPSVLLFFTGSGIYIAGEIIAAEKKRDSMTELSGRAESVVNSGDQSQYQSETSLIATDNEKANLRYLNTRSNFMKAYNITLGIAAVVALAETFFGGGGVVSCNASAGQEILVARSLAGAFNLLNNSNGEFKLAGMASGAIKGAFSDKIFNLLENTLGITKPIISTAMNTAPSRAFVFGAITGAGVLVQQELKESKEKLEGNVQTLEQVSSQFEDGSNHGITEGSVNSTATRKNEIKKLPEVSAPRKCIGENFQYSVAACSKKLKINKIAFKFSNEVPGLQSAINTATDYSQAVVDGNFARADVLRAELESSAARVSKIKEDLQKRINQKLVAEGKKEIDFNLESKQIMDQMKSDFAKSDVGQRFLAEENAKNQDKSQEKKSESNSSAKPSSVAVPSQAPKDLADDTDLSSLAGGDMASDVEINHDAIAALRADMKSSDGEGEIKKDPEESLFKQVSKRYFLNYERFFKKKEEVK